MPINRTLAAELAAAVHAQPRECWRNAALALFAYHGDAPACYVEGHLAICDGQVLIEHGWLGVDGCIVDPTLDDEDAADYHPVFRYGKDEVMAYLDGGYTLPFFVYAEQGRKAMRAAEWAWYQTPEPEA